MEIPYNKSMPSFKLTCTSFETRLRHSINLFPTSALLKETLSGFVLSTSATVACFFLTVFNKFGYWNFRAWVPNHLSSQNLNLLPLFSLNFPRFRNLSFTPMRLNQKCESPAFLQTRLKVLVLRYLFLSNCYHIPSSLHNLQSHLLSKYLF